FAQTITVNVIRVSQRLSPPRLLLQFRIHAVMPWSLMKRSVMRAIQRAVAGSAKAIALAGETKRVHIFSQILTGEGEKEGFPMPLTEEEHARTWIAASPKAYCNTQSKELLSRILPGFDQETVDFYRWKVRYTQEELQSLLLARTGIDFGTIQSFAA